MAAEEEQESTSSVSWLRPIDIIVPFGPIAFRENIGERLSRGIRPNLPLTLLSLVPTHQSLLPVPCLSATPPSPTESAL